MKTRKQKVITILASVFLLASFCLFPLAVSADSYKVATFHVPNLTEDQNLDYFRFVKSIDTLNSAKWNSMNRADSYFLIGNSVNDPVGLGYEWNWPNGYQYSGACSFYLGRSKFGVESYNVTDTVWVDPVDITFHYAFAYESTPYFRISLRAISGANDSLNDVGACIGRSEWIPIKYSNMVDDGAYTVSIPRTKLHILEGGSYNGLAVCIDVQCTGAGQRFGLGFYNNSLIVSYGQGKDPTIPGYAPPPGGSEIGSLGSAEDQIMNESQSGVDSGVQNISNFISTIGYFASALTVSSNILSKFMDVLPFSPLLSVSLSLGLCCSLLGLAGSIISAADRRASSAARSGQRSKK